MRKSTASLSASANVGPAASAVTSTSPLVESPLTPASAEDNPWQDAAGMPNPTQQTETDQSVNLLSFDSIVDQNGSLRHDITPEDNMEKTLELPSPPKDEPRSFGKKIAIEESMKPISSGFDVGSRWANPFGDEFELEDTGYATPKARAPSVPPKIALDDPAISVPDLLHMNKGKQPESSVRHVPIDDPEEQEIPDDMSYDEQLARALSLSLADEQKKRESIHMEENDPDLAAAIAASLADKHAHTQKYVQLKIDAKMEKMQDTLQQHMAKFADTRSSVRPSQPKRVLQSVDFSHQPPTSAPQPEMTHATPRTPTMDAPAQSSFDDHDSMYSLSPEYKAARLARSSTAFQPHALGEALSALPRDDDLDTASQDISDATRAAELQDFELWSTSELAVPQQYDPVHEAASINFSTRVGPSASSTAAEAGGLERPESPQHTNKHVLQDYSLQLMLLEKRNKARLLAARTEQAETNEEAAIQPSLDLRSVRLQPQIDFFQPAQADEKTAREALLLQSLDRPASNQRSQPPSSVPDLLDLLDFDAKTNPHETYPALPHTPTTTTFSPHAERDDIAFSTDSEDDFASAAASISHSGSAAPTLSTSDNRQRRASTASFVIEPANDLSSETASLVGHSDAESASLVDVDEGDTRRESSLHESVQHAQEEEDFEDDSSDDDNWGDGIRTPGSEWTDVGSEVSEEEIGGQDASRLVGA